MTKLANLLFTYDSRGNWTAADHRERGASGRRCHQIAGSLSGCAARRRDDRASLRREAGEGRGDHIYLAASPELAVSLAPTSWRAA